MVSPRPFPLTNLLRGRLAERILTVLLERGGYRVTRLGIEELFDEVKYLNREQYLTLGLPEQLRTLPDLLVTDPGVTWAKLIEVKYRRVFKKDTAAELFDTLTEQRRFWPQSYAVIILGHPFSSDDRFHQDYIRVVPADGIDLLKGPRGFDIPALSRNLTKCPIGAGFVISPYSRNSTVRRSGRQMPVLRRASLKLARTPTSSEVV